MNNIFNVLVILFFLHSHGIGQSTDDFQAVSGALQPSKTLPSYQALVDESKYKSEYDVILSLPFVFYKKYLSSQDYSSCNFHPSCSEYGLISMRSKGFVKGGIATFDRLIRCNPYGLRHYPYDPVRKKFLDP